MSGLRDLALTKLSPHKDIGEDMWQQRNVSERLKIAVRQVYGGVCQYCMKGDANHVDHIVPLARGGLNDIENLTLACEPCNLRKRDAMIPEPYIGIVLAIALEKARQIQKILEAQERKTKAAVAGFKKSAKALVQKLTVTDVYWKLHEYIQLDPDALKCAQEFLDLKLPATIDNDQHRMYIKDSWEIWCRFQLQFHYELDDGSINVNWNSMKRVCPSFHYTESWKKDKPEDVTLALTSCGFESDQKEWIRRSFNEDIHQIKIRDERDAQYIGKTITRKIAVQPKDHLLAEHP